MEIKEWKIQRKCKKWTMQAINNSMNKNQRNEKKEEYKEWKI